MTENSGLLKKHIEAREDLEMTFAMAAFSASCAGTVNALDIAALVPPEMLHGSFSYAIWRATVEVARKGQAPRVDTVWLHIHAGMVNPQPHEAPWPLDMSPTVVANYAMSNYAHSEDAVYFYAQKMREEGLKRMAEGKLTALLSESRKFANPPSEIAAGLVNLAAELEGGEPQTCDLSVLMGKVVESMGHGQDSLPMPTPWENLNQVLKGGFARGELAILAARPGMGKTALATCIAVETARRGIPTLFISREVKDLTLGQRMVAREASLDSAFFRQGLEHAQVVMPKVEAAAAKLAKLPLRVVEKSIAPMTVSEVRRLAKTTRGCGLVIVDYLQLLNPEKREANREREVAEMSRAMKQLALDCDCPVLLLSQLNRQAEEGNREPRLSDLRESGAIEQDADIVIFLHAKKDEVKRPEMPVRAIVAKGRSSGTGSANLVFKKPFASFIPDWRSDAWREDAAFQGNDL